MPIRAMMSDCGYKGALIDFGGTIDTDGIHWMKMFSMAYGACGLPADGLRDAYVHTERTLGREPVIRPDFTFRETLRRKIAMQLDYMCIRADEERLLDFCYGYVCRNIAEVSSPVLKYLSERMPLVLVTNFYGNMHTVLEEFGIACYFKDVAESAVLGVRKPDPEIFRIGARMLGIDPHDAVAIGDSPDKDIAPASAIGCATIMVSPENSLREVTNGVRPSLVTAGNR